MLKYLTIVLLCHGLLPNFSAKRIGKSSLLWDTFVDCPGFENKFVDFSNLKIEQFNETSSIVGGSINLKIAINKPFPVVVTFEREVGYHSYLPLLSLEEMDACNVVNATDRPWSPYIYSFRPPPTSCPVPKTTFDMSGMITETKSIILTKEMAGKYQVRIEFFNSTNQGKPVDKWFCAILNVRVINF